MLVRDYAKPTTTYYILPHNPVSSYCYSLWCWEPSAAGNAAGSTRREAKAAAAPQLNTGGYRLVANIQCSLAWQSEYAKWTKVVNRSKGRTREKTWRMLLLTAKGGFQLLYLIIPELKSHVIPYKFKCSHWWKIYL